MSSLITLDGWSNWTDEDFQTNDTPLSVVGTRDRVNWYRGSADPNDPPPGAFDETSNPPTQKTHYETSDDPNADPDNPASDGEGLRSNVPE